MPRPKLKRKVSIEPKAIVFEPRNSDSKTTYTLNHEELQALHLVDGMGYSQTESARFMETSQSTLQRILSSARRKLARCITSGSTLFIDVNA